MKKIYSLLLAAACVAGAVVAQRSTATDVATAPKAAISVEGKQLRQLAPVERTKSAQSAFSQTARLEVATTARLENATITGMQKADDNPTIEGSWTFSLGDYYFQTSVNGTITYTYEATLEGSDVWFDDPTGNELPFVAQYDEAAGKLTFKREYLGSTGQYHVYQEPFVYNYTTNDLDLQDIVGTYNATAGKITFNADNGISWAAYSTAAGSGDPLGYFSIYDLESAVKAQAGGDSGDDDWEYVGDATFVDAWILPSYSMSGVQINPNDHPYKVQLHRNLENENLYRLWEPYKNSMLSTLNQVSPDGGQIVFDITDPDHVIVKAGYRAGFANSNGDFYLFGLLGWQIYGYGNSYNDSYLPGIIEFMEQHDQEFDVLEGNVLTIHPFFDFDASCESAYSWTTNPYVTTITFPDGVLADLPDTDTPEIDGIIYQVNRETMTAEVTGCTSSLTNLNIPETIRVKSGTMTVTSVAASAFYGNRTITSATIPATIEAMGTDAFRNVTNLRTLNIADLAAWCAIEFANGNANPIYNVFPTTGSAGTVNINGAPVTTTLTVPEGVTSIGRAFYGFKSLTDVTLPTTLVTLGDQAFTNCTGLTKIEIPEGVTTIGSAFFGCSNLAEVALPSTLTTLKSSTFYNCSSLTSIVLPEALETIGMMAFCGCSALTEITSLAAVPPTASVMAFDAVNKEIPVYVPAGSIEDYKAAAEWEEFTNYVGLNDNVTVGDIYYKLNLGSKTATVTGCAATLTDLNIAASVTDDDVEYPVTSVAASAFQGNRTITSATIPASIKEVGYDAFRNLTNLRTLNIADLAAWCAIEFTNGNANPIYNVFPTTGSAGTVNINGTPVTTTLTVPEGVTSIGRAFYGFKSLTDVTLPTTLVTLGDQAFTNCTGLTKIEIPEGVTTIGSAFFGCSNLAEVTLPSTLTTLKGSTFYNCSSLTSIVLPEALETIGAMTFNGCSALTEIISPAAVPPTAGVMAFDGVDKEIPVYVLEESIEAYKAAAEWKEFTNYQRLIFTEIEQGDIYYSLDVDALTATVTGCAETLMLLNIPATVTSQGATYAVTAIAESAFAGNANFISAVIPASITAIDADAFKGLTSLATLNIVDLAAWCGIEFANGDANPMAVAKNVYIGGKSVSSGVEMPETVTALSAYAFYGAKTLSEVTLPATLETIGAEAFSGCTGLTLITSNATVPPTAGTGAFTGVDKTIPVMVPAEAVEAYKTAAEWKEFTNYNNESGIASIIADGAEAEYYNLNGVRVDNPSAGVYIRKQGNTVTKVIVK